jgi:hypothetical protein
MVLFIIISVAAGYYASVQKNSSNLLTCNYVYPNEVSTVLNQSYEVLLDLPKCVQDYCQKDTSERIECIANKLVETSPYVTDLEQVKEGAASNCDSVSADEKKAETDALAWVKAAITALTDEKSPSQSTIVSLTVTGQALALQFF